MHRSGSEECSSHEAIDDDNTLDRCDGVTSPWQAWYTSEVPKQVRVGCGAANSWTAYIGVVHWTHHSHVAHVC